MPRKANQSEDWNFSVTTQQLALTNGRKLKAWALIRTDTEEYLGPCSEKGYGILQNWDYISTIRTCLDSLGLTGFAENIITVNDGRRLYASYSFDNRVKTLHKVGDEVGLVLRFTNSFDTSLAARGEVAAKILRCLNGATTPEGEFSLQQRHNSKINPEFAKKVIAEAVHNFDRSIAVFDALGGVAISDEQGVNILARAPISQVVREKIQSLWINPNFKESRKRTLYSLYDAATEHLRDLSSSRFEQSQKLNRQLLRHVMAGLDPVELAKLVIPLPPELQVAETGLSEGVVIDV